MTINNKASFIDPHNTKLENYTLGMAFKSPELADIVINSLSPEDYYEDFNHRVFTAITNLREIGQAITSLTVEADCLADYSGEEIPFDFPSQKEITRRYGLFINQPPDGLPEAIRRLKEDTNYRKVIDAATEAIAAARMKTLTPLEILSPIENVQSEIMQAGKPVIVWADELERQAQEKYDKMDAGELVGIPTGFPEMDEKIWGGGMFEGDYWVLSGATSGGKTTLALNMLDNAAELGFRDLYFSAEMSNFKIFSRIHSRKAKIPGYKIRPKMTELYGADRKGKTVRDKLRETGGMVGRLPFGVIDSVRDMETVRKVTKLGVRNQGVNRIIIDYEGLFKPSKRFHGGRYERATLVSEMCKEIAEELKIPVIGLNQLRRKSQQEKAASNNGNGTDAGNEVEPDLEMLKESGAIENNADGVIFLWGEKGKEGETDAVRHIKFKVAKQRNGELFRGNLHFAPAVYNFISPRDAEKQIREQQQKEF